MSQEGSEQGPVDVSPVRADATCAPPGPDCLPVGSRPVAAEASSSRRRRPLEWLKSELAITKGLEEDRWSHRRGEPRTFAFLWAIYLMLGSIIALGIVLAGGIITLDAYQPLSRALVVTLTVGVLVFWPVIRLSQEAPDEGSLRAILKDLAIVLVPLQAVLWPQMYLARWNVEIVAATSLAMIAWAAMVGALLVIALRSNNTWRAAWMVLILGLALGGSAFAVVYGSATPDLLRPRQAGAAPTIVLASGVGLVADISADRSWSGSWALVLPAHWTAIRWTFAFAAIAWVAAFWVARNQRRIEYNPIPETGSPGLTDGLDSGGASGGLEGPIEPQHSVPDRSFSENPRD